MELNEFVKSCFAALFGEIARRVFVCDLLAISVLWGRAIIPALRVFVWGDIAVLPVAAVCETIKTRCLLVLSKTPLRKILSLDSTKGPEKDPKVYFP